MEWREPFDFFNWYFQFCYVEAKFALHHWGPKYLSEFKKKSTKHCVKWKVIRRPYVKTTHCCDHLQWPHVRRSKTVLIWNSTPWIPDLFQWNLILDSNRWWDTGFLELHSGFQRTEFWIPQQAFAGFRIPQAKISRIPESGFSYIGDICHFVCRFLLSFPSVISRKQDSIQLVTSIQEHFIFYRIFRFLLCLCVIFIFFSSQSANGQRSGLLFSDVRSHCEI